MKQICVKAVRTSKYLNRDSDDVARTGRGTKRGALSRRAAFTNRLAPSKVVLRNSTRIFLRESILIDFSVVQPISILTRINRLDKKIDFCTPADRSRRDFSEL
jgi:hypothetical protein